MHARLAQCVLLALSNHVLLSRATFGRPVDTVGPTNEPDFKLDPPSAGPTVPRDLHKQLSYPPTTFSPSRGSVEELRNMRSEILPQALYTYTPPKPGTVSRSRSDSDAVADQRSCLRFLQGVSDSPTPTPKQQKDLAMNRVLISLLKSSKVKEVLRKPAGQPHGGISGALLEHCLRLMEKKSQQND